MFHELKLLEGSKLRGYPVLPRFSWHSEIGFINENPQCHACASPRALFDLGKSKSFLLEKLDLHAMFRALYHDHIQANGFGLGLGLSIGLFYTPFANFRCYLNASRARNSSGIFLDEFKTGWNLDGPKESDIRLTARLQRFNGKMTRQEFSIGGGISF